MVLKRLRTIAAGAVRLLALPSAAHAASFYGDDACGRARAAAETAEHEYTAYEKELQDRVADGGHPDRSGTQVLSDAEARRGATASQAQRACGA